MGLNGNCRGGRAPEWVDRVAPADETLDAAWPDIEGPMNDAAAIGRVAVECCVEPLREILAALPRIISIEVQGWRPGRFNAGWDARRRGARAFSPRHV